MTNANTGNQGNGNDNSNKGFASMPEEKVGDIAKKGGEASAAKAGHEGMAERGRHGGEASGSQQAEIEEEDEE